jgi:FkbH-like protein
MPNVHEVSMEEVGRNCLSLLFKRQRTVQTVQAASGSAESRPTAGSPNNIVEQRVGAERAKECGVFQVTWRDLKKWRKVTGDDRVPAPPADPLVSHAGLLCWEEHCVECSMPQCYSTCSLFIARPDQKCARFTYGIVPNRQVSGLFGYGADIRFRRWAKLQTAWPTRLAMLSTGTIRMQTALLESSETVVNWLAEVVKRWSPKRRLSGAFTAARRKLLENESALLSHQSPEPQALFIKCYSPETSAFRIQVELVTDVPVFRTSLPIVPGWNEHSLDAKDLISLANGKPGVLKLSIEDDREVRIIFTWLDFVCLHNKVPSISQIGHVSRKNAQTPELPAASASAAASKIKCVAWDLDNTLWHGVIGDAGASGVTPNREMIDLIQRLDERGILQTIVSKNHHDTAWPKIEELGLADYFLFPAIHWGPKSQSVQQIADELNINVDTFAVIDDSPFERHEISNLLPQVRVFDPATGSSLIEDKAFDVPVSDESRVRRLKYLTEAKRKRVHQSWRGDYHQFLKNCHMVLQIRHPEGADHSRCIELLQRSNQFNLSGRVYLADDFQQLLESARHDAYCLEVTDDFGGYGIVGFAAFEATVDGPQLVDFVLSCRVAQKMVEATFLNWYAARQQRLGHHYLQARLRVTARNAPLREVLSQLGFVCVSSEDDRQLLELRFQESVTIPDVIEVDDQTLLRSDSISQEISPAGSLRPEKSAA